MPLMSHGKIGPANSTNEKIITHLVLLSLLELLVALFCFVLEAAAILASVYIEITCLRSRLDRRGASSSSDCCMALFIVTSYQYMIDRRDADMANTKRLVDCRLSSARGRFFVGRPMR